MNTTRTTATKRAPMDAQRKTALTVGVFFLVTLLAAIPAALLIGPVVDDPRYVLGPGNDGRVLLGAFFEIITIAANIATAIVLFPILRRRSEGIALGYVAARLVEAILMVVGLLAIISVVTLRQQAAGADPGSLLVAGQSLVAVNRWTFVLGPGFVAGVGNGLILGYLMFKSGLVPRRLALFGLVGGPLVAASGIAILLGFIERGSAAQGLATILEVVWEIGIMGLYLIFRGFKPTPALAPETDERAIAPAYASA